MATRIGINGFGRIGRLVARAALSPTYHDRLDLVAVNGLGDTETSAHLFKYDSTYGPYAGTVGNDNGNLVIDGKPIRVFQEAEPANIPWSEMGVDIVVECTGHFTDAAKAAAHIDSGGANKVIISAPATGADATIVLGVNDEVYDDRAHRIISNASCTTNCFAPMVKVLHDAFGVERGLMTTIHAYTNDQSILDRNHRDLRRARAAAQNIIPTSTGAARSVGVVLPELNGKLHGIAYRIPTSVGSATDFVADLKQDVTRDDVNAAFKAAADGSLRGILEYTEDPIVSSDIRGNTHSCIFDGLSTMVLDNSMVKILGWYDNEWGYSCRTADLCCIVGG
ncbi:Glyceraldehyde-3-phosphate dehydrogenase 2 [Geodia barretti]|jgi:glyceraldehyde 3-phosphate dehydrogenase|uniref:glyceraldehyde-3-phosphate dehydrogenase (NADP(+)) (phosphorylating) n=1 Tax=Geodia barretti TaxID=519541 RepID=A0AA35RWG3_GEOBA|nr:Glyceraldehyde-3-phosphate dehydrogenase 2 [Geodia barretti]